MNIGKIISAIIGKNSKITGSQVIKGFQTEAEGQVDICRSMNSAFIICLSGKDHNDYNSANIFLQKMREDNTYAPLTNFLIDGLSHIETEIKNQALVDIDFSTRLSDLNRYSKNHKDFSTLEAMDALWSVFFPEAEGVFTDKDKRSKELRDLRTVKITAVNPEPITNPGEAAHEKRPI